MKEPSSTDALERSCSSTPDNKLARSEIDVPGNRTTTLSFVAGYKDRYSGTTLQNQNFDTSVPGGDEWSSYLPQDMPELLDIEWFMQTQIVPDTEDNHSAINEATLEHNVALELTNQLPVTSGLSYAPVYLWETQSKSLSREELHEAPAWGFRICNALTEARKSELILALRNMADIDSNDPKFSMNSMKQGIYMHGRYISSQYSIHHPEVLFPSSCESRAALSGVFGEEIPPECTWAVITIGWSLMRSECGQELKMAVYVQRLLRKYVVNVSKQSLVIIFNGSLQQVRCSILHLPFPHLYGLFRLCS